MDMESKLHKAADYNKTMQNHMQNRYAADSSARISKVLARKFQTTFIGALSAFENEFGHLWGNGLSLSSLTEEQRQNRIIWDRVRNTVLTNGNNQLRAAQTEVSEYHIEWNRHNITIKGKDNEDQKGNSENRK